MASATSGPGNMPSSPAASKIFSNKPGISGEQPEIYYMSHNKKLNVEQVMPTMQKTETLLVLNPMHRKEAVDLPRIWKETLKGSFNVGL
jgi:hypothetical protein